jgi:proline iminopeptidase
MFNFRCVHVPRTTAFDSTLPSIRVNGYSFHAETFGDPASPPLIVIHGGPGADYSCLLSLAMLSDEYHVLFYDQRGSGLSPREDRPDPSMEAFVRDLDSLVDLHGMGKKMRLIGHSWGGIMVTAYLTRYPDKVSHAVVAEPGVLHPESAKAFVMKLREYLTFWRKISVLPIILRYPFVFSEDGHERMDYIATKILESSEGPPYQCEGEKLPSGICRRAGYAIMKATVVPLMEDPALFRVDYTDGLQKYAEKILLLSSECSFIGYEFQERHHRPRFPRNTQHVMIGRTGHNMLTLKPAESLEIIRPFLRQ